MTVPSAVSLIAGPFEGNGVTTTFAYQFPVRATGELGVWHYSEEGVPAKLTKGVHYSSTESVSGGSVVLTAPLAVGQRLALSASYAEDQQADFTSQGRFFPQIHEDAMDDLSLQIKQLRRDFSRAAQIPADPVSKPTITAGTLRADTVLVGEDDWTQILTELGAQVFASAQAASDAEVQAESHRDSALNAATSVLEILETQGMVLAFPLDLGFIVDANISQSYDLGGLL